jgi:hypothetical protein
MLAELPRHCAVGTKRNAKGHTTSWIGYELHLYVADGDIPISALARAACSNCSESSAAVTPFPLLDAVPYSDSLHFSLVEASASVRNGGPVTPPMSLRSPAQSPVLDFPA